jgi:hypothetical protein
MSKFTVEQIQEIKRKAIRFGVFDADTPTAQVFDQLIEQLNAINSPELHEFAKGTMLESIHQHVRWGESHDADKTPADWFWTLSYLAGKALAAHIAGDTDKALHHTISSEGLLANWHAAILRNKEPS